MLGGFEGAFWDRYFKREGEEEGLFSVVSDIRYHNASKKEALGLTA